MSLPRRPVARSLILAAFASASVIAQAATVTLLNVSYDVTREFYKDYDAAFIAHWKQAGGRRSSSTSRTAARASRHAASSTAWRPT